MSKPQLLVVKIENPLQAGLAQISIDKEDGRAALARDGGCNVDCRGGLPLPGPCASHQDGFQAGSIQRSELQVGLEEFVRLSEDPSGAIVDD